jgi:hypothetical protein
MPKRLKAAIVWWDDAWNSEDTGWIPTGKIDRKKLESPMGIVSVGLLYRKTKKVLVLAQATHRHDSREANVLGLFTIPRACVRRVKRVRV